MEKPTEVGLKNVRCYCLIESKIYEQMDGPYGSRWQAVGSKTVMSGQMMVNFLFGNDQGVDFTSSGFSDLGVNEKKILAISNMI